MKSKPWSKLQSRLYNLIDENLNFQIHCIVYPMHSERGPTGLPRYWITLDKNIIWDYPKQFVDKKLKKTESSKLIHTIRIFLKYQI